MTTIPRRRAKSSGRARGIPSRDPGRSLTELEGAVLGCVRAYGPCTPYRVRMEFARSPSPYWSGSAGSIYPLMARLERRGLLRSAAHASGDRKCRRFVLAPAGSRALAGWLGPPLSDPVVGVPPDPLRTRIGFLGALDRRRRRAFLAEARSRLGEHLRLAREDLARRRGEDVYARLMAEGAVSSLRARIAWLRAVAARIARVRPGGGK